MKNIYLIITIFRLSISRSLELNVNSNNGVVLYPIMELEHKNIYNMISSDARGFNNELIGKIYYPPILTYSNTVRKSDEQLYLDKTQFHEETDKFQNIPVNHIIDSSHPEMQIIDNSNQIKQNGKMQYLTDQIKEDFILSNMPNHQNYRNNINDFEEISEDIKAALSKMDPKYIVTPNEPIIQNIFLQNNDIQMEKNELNQLNDNLIEEKNETTLHYTNENSEYLTPKNQEYLKPQYPNTMFHANQNFYGNPPQELEFQENINFHSDKLRNTLLSEHSLKNQLNVQYHKSNMIRNLVNSNRLNDQVKVNKDLSTQVPEQMFKNNYNRIYLNTNNKNIGPIVNSQLLGTTFSKYRDQKKLQDNIFQPKPHLELRKPILQTSIYSYAPQEESEEDKQAEIDELNQKNIHYKVIFIRAPQQITKKNLQFAKSLNKEQTVIYVLSKKIDHNEIREAINAIPKQIIKPEVHFLKYKTNEEAAYTQNQIQAQYNSLGGTTTVNNEEIAPTHIVNKALVSIGSLSH